MGMGRWSCTGLVALLLSVNAWGDENRAARYRFSRLDGAVRSGQLALTEALLKGGVPLRQDANSTVATALVHGNAGMIALMGRFVDWEHAPELADSGRRNDLLRAATQAGNMTAVRFLVDRGAAVHQPGKDFLHVAAHRGHDDITVFLLEQGADPGWGRFKYGLAHEAADGGAVRTLGWIAKHRPERLAVVDNRGTNALCWAVKGGSHDQAARFLIASGQKTLLPSVKDCSWRHKNFPDGGLAHVLAAHDMGESLLELLGGMEEQTALGEELLAVAMESGAARVVRLLIAKGFDPQPEKISHLLKRQPALAELPQLQNADALEANASRFVQAAAAGSLGATRALLEAHPQKPQSSKINEALRFAVDSGNGDLVSYLLDQGGAVNIAAAAALDAGNLCLLKQLLARPDAPKSPSLWPTFRRPQALNTELFDFVHSQYPRALFSSVWTRWQALAIRHGDGEFWNHTRKVLGTPSWTLAFHAIATPGKSDLVAELLTKESARLRWRTAGFTQSFSPLEFALLHPDHETLLLVMALFHSWFRTGEGGFTLTLGSPQELKALQRGFPSVRRWLDQLVGVLNWGRMSVVRTDFGDSRSSSSEQHQVSYAGDMVKLWKVAKAAAASVGGDFTDAPSRQRLLQKVRELMAADA